MDKIRFMLCLLACTILQVAILSDLKINGIHYELLFCFLIFLSIKYDWIEGIYGGFCVGLLHDIFSNGPFGLSVLSFSLAGLGASLFKQVIFTQHITTRLLILFIMSIIHSQGLNLFFLQESISFESFESLLKVDILTIAIVNTLFSIPLFHYLEIWFHENK